MSQSTIDEYKLVKVVDMDQIFDVLAMDYVTWDVPILKISKDQYIRTDQVEWELFNYNHTENRGENMDSVRRSLKRIRYLVNANFRGKPNELFITLTYAENMTDTKRLYTDFDKFIKRLKYKYGSIDYINVIEPQGRGAWHCHLLIRFNDYQKMYIANQDLRDLWGHGFVRVNALSKQGQSISNIGAYLSAYLADIDLTDPAVKENNISGEVKTVIVDGKEKKYIKGGRLVLYPTGVNIYRKSKGIVEPDIYWTSYQNVKKITGNADPSYSKKIEIKDKEDPKKIFNTITYESFNLR